MPRIYPLSTVLTLLVLLMSLAACAGASTPAARACAEPASGNKLLTNETVGYCLIYPDQYVQEGGPTATLLNPAPGSQGQEPRRPFVSIDVGPADGKTSAEVADALQATLPEFPMARSTLTMGGAEAVVLDRVPGQDLSRQLFLTRGDDLITFTFVPSDATMGEEYEQMELLYSTITRSFQFLPEP